MSDAMSDGDVFHPGGMSHSRRRSCAICREVAEKARRAGLSEVERLTEDIMKDVLSAIMFGSLKEYTGRLALRIHEAEELSEVSQERLDAARATGAQAERDRIRGLLREYLPEDVSEG